MDICKETLKRKPMILCLLTRHLKNNIDRSLWEHTLPLACRPVRELYYFE